MNSKLSPTLFTAFKQYKKDTARLATWLGDTATSLGYDFSSTAPDTPKKPQSTPASSPSPAKSTARSKGQLKSAAKTTLTKETTELVKPHVVDADADVPTTVMTTTQFLDLAHFIAAASPAVTVPTRVIDWACRAVMARRECAEWFRTPSPSERANVDDQASEAIEKSNHTHNYFIGVLEQVVSILAVRVGPSGGRGNSPSKSQQPQKPPMTGVELLESRFAAISLEPEESQQDDSDNDDNSDWDAVDAVVRETLASNNTPSPSSSSARRRKFKVKCDEDIEEEFYFKYTGLIYLFEETRAFITETWGLYLAGSVDVETASISTLTALDRVQAENDALVAEYPKHMADHFNYASLVVYHHCAENNIPFASPNEQELADICHDDAWSLARAVMVPMVHVVAPMLGGIRAGQNMLPGWLFTGQPGSQQEQLMEWTNQLVVYYNSWAQLDSHHFKFFVPDPVRTAFESLKTVQIGQDVPLMTLYLFDIHLSILGKLNSTPGTDYAARLVGDFDTANRFYIASLNAFSANLPPRSSELWSADPARYISKFPRDYFFWITDSDTFCIPGMDSARELFHVVFANCPMLVGLVLMRTRVNMLTFAVTMADLWQSVLYGAYVHEALRLKDAGSEGQGDWGAESWPLMHQFIDLYGAESIFFGREPDSMRSLWTSMNLAFGTLSFKDLQAWQESSRSGAPVPLMKFEGKATKPKASKNGAKGGKRKGGSSAAAGGNHRRQRGCDDAMKKVVVLKSIIESAGPVGRSGVAARMRSAEIVERLLLDRPISPRASAAYLAKLDAAVVNGMPEEAAKAAHNRRGRRGTEFLFLRELRSLVGTDLVPIFKHDLLRLHVQSVKLLQMLREEIVEKDRLSVLISKCVNCRRRDDFLPVTAWNLIRALGADEGTVTGQPLGPVQSAMERKEGLTIRRGQGVCCWVGAQRPGDRMRPVSSRWCKRFVTAQLYCVKMKTTTNAWTRLSQRTCLVRESHQRQG